MTGMVLYLPEAGALEIEGESRDRQKDISPDHRQHLLEEEDLEGAVETAAQEV